MYFITLNFLLFTLLLVTPSQSLAQTMNQVDHDFLFCESWRLSVETNNAGNWSNIPDHCVEYVKEYMTSNRFVSDSKIVVANSLKFARSVNISGDGKDAWVFDIAETLVTFLPYYITHGFGSSKDFREWTRRNKAPALQASLSLYKELQQLGFSIVLLTGASEPDRNQTIEFLQYAGYSNWERLILRGASDEGKSALDFKSGKRKELEDEGYRIHGNSGDQWSDLLGYYSIATRSFKLPNPMFYTA